MKKFYAAIAIILLATFIFPVSVLAKEKAGTPFVVETKPFEEVYSHSHPSGDKDAPHSHWTRSEKITVDRDLIVTSINAEVVNAPGHILHHAMLYKVGTPNDICPNLFGNLKEIYAVSMNTIGETVTFEKPYALFIPKGTVLTLEAMEHTALPPFGPGGVYENVSVRVTLNTVESKIGRNLPLNFQRLRIDDTPCAFPPAHEAFTVPTGAKNFVKVVDKNNLAGAFTFKKKGVIVGIGGNFWPMKGGERVDAILNDASVVSLYPTKPRDETPWAWKIPSLQRTKIAVKTGDKIRLSSNYTNPYSNQQISDASGMIGFYYTEQK